MTFRMQSLLLLGAGHAHVQVLHQLAQRRPAHLQLTVVAPYPRQLYSGMTPGLVAGHYREAQCAIELPPLIAATQARYIASSVVALDTAQKRATLVNGDTLSYDWLSINTGPVLERERVEALIPGAREHALFVRPIETFVALWPRLAALGRERALRLAVIGGGAAGLELAMACAHALRQPHGAHVTLVTGPSGAGADYPHAVRERIARALKTQGVTVLQESCNGLKAGEVQLASGARLACDAALLALGAQAPAWLAGSGLALDASGFIHTNQYLQSVNQPSVFAAGDVATRADCTHPRSGVYAVRAGAPLAHNLMAALNSQALKPYAPPRRTLNLLSCGARYAIASWGPWSAQGRWVWRWKDRIDRRFIEKYQYGKT